MPKVYIIILNYCGWQDTIACLESLFKLSYTSYHIVLVDNCSPNNSIENILKWTEGRIQAKVDNLELSFLVSPYSDKPLCYHFFEENDFELINKQPNNTGFLTIIKAKENRGYSAGNNVGIRYALVQNDCDYFWLLNNDTLVTPNSLYELVQYHQECNDLFKIGIVGGKLLYYYEPNLIQCLGGATYNPYLGLIKQIGNRLPNTLENNASDEHIDYINGACMLVKREFIQDVGFLAEDYFFYYEELDWCTRGLTKGWNIAYTVKALFIIKKAQLLNLVFNGQHLKANDGLLLYKK